MDDSNFIYVINNIYFVCIIPIHEVKKIKKLSYLNEEMITHNLKRN